MASGRVSASRMLAMVRPLSRSSTDCGKVGADRTARIRSSAASRSGLVDKVRTLMLARSVSAPPPIRAPMSTRRPAICSSSRSAAPVSSRPCVRLARPDLPAGTKAVPAAKSICTSRMGSTRVSTKYTFAPEGAIQCSILTPARANVDVRDASRMNVRVRISASLPRRASSVCFDRRVADRARRCSACRP